MTVAAPTTSGMGSHAAFNSSALLAFLAARRERRDDGSTTDRGLGLALVGINEGMGAELNHAKVGVKLLVAVAVVACCEIAWAKRKRGESSPLPWVALVLTLVNTAVAYLWT